MEYIGIDLSLTNTGMARAQPGHLVRAMWNVQIVPIPDIDARLLIVVCAVLDSFDSAECVFVLEGLSRFSISPLALEIAGLHYLLRSKLVELGRKFVVVPPTTLKKFICGTGAAKKELMLKEMFRRYGVDTDDNNQADAAALAIFGLAHDGHIAMTQVQADQMRSFKLPKVKKAKKGRAA